MGELNLAADPYQNFLKIQALAGWPGTYFFTERAGAKIRVKITDASFNDGVLTIEKVIPEGKKEMAYEDFLRGQ
jgi:methionyl-tRNA formyltransferase